MVFLIMENTKWKKICEYNYSVSTSGVVRNDKTNKILKNRIHRQGYLRVLLYKNGKPKDFLIHRLVLITFNPIDNYISFDVNHRNCIKSDNDLCNLEWATRKENCEHAVRNMLYPRCEKHHRCRLSDKDVLNIRILCKDGMTQSKIANKYNINQSVVSRYVNNKRGGAYR